MKLKKIKDNCHELNLDNGTLVLFSYDTVVAVSLPGVRTIVDEDANRGETAKRYIGVYKTEVKYSKTTSGHINAWTSTTKTLPQAELEALAVEATR